MLVTLVPIVTIPVSLVGAFGLMYFFGFTINTLTLLACLALTAWWGMGKPLARVRGKAAWTAAASIPSRRSAACSASRASASASSGTAR